MKYLAGVAALFAASLAAQDTVPAREEKKPLPEAGDVAIAHIAVADAKLPIGTSNASLVEMLIAATGPNPTAALVRLVVSGKMLLVDNDVKVLVIEPGGVGSEVRLMAGPDKGKRGWVANAFLQTVTPSPCVASR
jgi:hypothetical protein